MTEHELTSLLRTAWSSVYSSEADCETAPPHLNLKTYMSLGIGIVLPSAVLLVSDGRRTLPLLANASPENDAHKIVLIHDKLAVIQFGVVQGTEPAVKHLQSHGTGSIGVHETVDLLQKSIDHGWQSFRTRLAADVDTSHPAIRVALVAGGIVRTVPFIAGVLRDLNPPQPATVRTSPYNFIVLGGEEHGAQAEFTRRATTVVQQLGGCAVRFTESLFEGMLDAAGATIRITEVADPSVGGVIRWQLLCSDAPAEQGVWSGLPT